MTREEKIKVLAELDGFLKCDGGWLWLMGSPCPDYSPDDYLTSYDAIIPLIQKQPTHIRSSVSVSIGLKHDWCEWLNTSPEQLANALIKAVGKWKD